MDKIPIGINCRILDWDNEKGSYVVSCGTPNCNYVGTSKKIFYKGSSASCTIKCPKCHNNIKAHIEWRYK
ncbi:MAG: hypothetical protein IJS60_08160 [Abditibacteriota bacterium]|nr:hypothetical protein [Abditibacteriota bacterium]